MRHAGDGSVAAPLTWSAVTEFGEGREADLRIAILIPEPSSDDRGAFWRAWGGRRADNLMPEVTGDTPVIVTGSASVVLTVDPDIIDLEAPALLIVHGDQGRLVYRSRDVAPARGDAWNSRGARWIFAPDADFYRALRGGGRVSFEVHSRMSDRDIRIPFDSDDFGPSARAFERSLGFRLAAIEERWQRARDGRPPPPPPTAPQPMATLHPAPAIVPPSAAMPAGGSPNRADRGQHGAGAQTGQASPTPAVTPQSGSVPAPTTSASSTAPPPAEPGNSRERGQHHDAVGTPRAATLPSAMPVAPPPIVPPGKSAVAETVSPRTAPAPHQSPNAPAPVKPSPAPAAPPAKSVVAETVSPAPAPHRSPNAPAPVKPPPAPAALPAPIAKASQPAILVTPPKPAPAVNAVESTVAAYRPPTEQCGPRPDLSTAGLEGAAPEEFSRARESYAGKEKWIGCRTQWMKRYDMSLTALEQSLAVQGRPLATTPGGKAVTQAHDVAKRGYDADTTQWTQYVQAFRAAEMKARVPLSRPVPASGPTQNRL